MPNQSRSTGTYRFWSVEGFLLWLDIRRYSHHVSRQAKNELLAYSRHVLNGLLDRPSLLDQTGRYARSNRRVYFIGFANLLDNHKTPPYSSLESDWWYTISFPFMSCLFPLPTEGVLSAVFLTVSIILLRTGDCSCSAVGLVLAGATENTVPALLAHEYQILFQCQSTLHR